MNSATITAAASGTCLLGSAPRPRPRLAWTLDRGPHLLAVPGAGNPGHLVEDIAHGALRPAPERIALLEAA
ncbi:aldo-keto reductase family protein [Streptomyces vinaceus]|uniref:hypothetical protein n=1 Tax=Streptomyces vinaceus TaxID=1960 RepID=UPI0038132C90